MSKTRMIGIKISDGSNLPERFKAVAVKTGLEYAELLDKWLGIEERGGAGLDQLSLFPEEAAQVNQLNPTVKPEQQELNQPGNPKLEARIAALESQLAALLEQGQLNHSSTVTVEPEIEPAPEVKAGPLQTVAAPVEAPQPQEWQQTEALIMEMHGQGASMGVIAKQLEVQGIKSKNGSPLWSRTMVKRVIDRRKV